MLLASQYLPTGARFEPLPDGFAFVFADPTTRVEVHERLAPLRRARAIFDAALGITTTAPIRDCLTREGEFAAMLAMASTTRRVELGVVYGDDSYRFVIGHTAEAALSDEITTCVRRLTVEFPLGLAVDRRRRFRYAPPPRWSSLSRHGLITEWYAPGWPASGTKITVYPSSPLREALPSRAFDRSVHEMQWGGFVPSSTSGPLPVSVSHFHAQEWQLAGSWSDGARTQITLVVLHDNARTYVLRLDHDGDADEHRETLRAVAASVRPMGRTH